VITDLMLPGMTGWQVIDAIRGRVPGVPVIVTAGVDDPSVRTRVRQCQVSLLLKPFRLDELKAALADALYARAPFPRVTLPPPGAIRLTGEGGGTQSGELTAQLLRQVGGPVASGTLLSWAASGLRAAPRGTSRFGSRRLGGITPQFRVAGRGDGATRLRRGCGWCPSLPRSATPHVPCRAFRPVTDESDFGKVYETERLPLRRLHAGV
jgi:Response regulator receiver domain